MNPNEDPTWQPMPADITCDAIVGRVITAARDLGDTVFMSHLGEDHPIIEGVRTHDAAVRMLIEYVNVLRGREWLAQQDARRAFAHLRDVAPWQEATATPSPVR